MTRPKTTLDWTMLGVGMGALALSTMYLLGHFDRRKDVLRDRYADVLGIEVADIDPGVLTLEHWRLTGRARAAHRLAKELDDAARWLRAQR